jgi:hypothetical protein
MIDAGRLQEAEQQLSGRSQDAETLYLTGRLWAKKAVTAPLPTPPPAASPLPRGAQLPPAPEFKPEEIQAVSYNEKAVAARPDYAAAHVGLARAARAPRIAPGGRRDRRPKRRASGAAASRRRRRPPCPTRRRRCHHRSRDRAYQFAIQADPTSATCRRR